MITPAIVALILLSLALFFRKKDVGCPCDDGYPMDCRTHSGSYCPLCGEHYLGLAQDCRCTNYGKLDGKA